MTKLTFPGAGHSPRAAKAGSLLLTVAIACAGLVVMQGPAHAARHLTARVTIATRVALLPMRGPYGEKLRDALATGLGEACAVVPLGVSDRALRRTGGVPRRSGGWTMLGRRLAGAALVSGDVTSGPVWRVRLVVRRGALLVGTFIWEDLEPLRLMEAFLNEAPRKITELLIRPEGSRLSRRQPPARRRTALAIATPTTDERFWAALGR
jgi:hypothetical protein